MSPNTPQAAEVKAAIDGLIQSASNAEFDILEEIYHDDMQIYMFDPDRNLNQMDKRAFSQHVTTSTEAAEAPNIWAKYHLVEADEKEGHVLISRKVNLTGEERIVTLSIDLVREDDRWQITREVIFT